MYRHLLQVFFLFSSVLLFSNTNPVLVDNIPIEGISLYKHISYFEDKDKAYNIKEVASFPSDSFKIIGKDLFLPIKPWKWWLKFELNNPTDSIIELIVIHKKLNKSTLYYSEKFIPETLSYTTKSQKPRVFTRGHDFFTCSVPPKTIKAFYIEIEHIHSKLFFDLFRPEVGWQKVHHLFSKDAYTFLFRAGFLSITIFLSITFFLQFLLNKDKSYLFYSIYLFTIFFAYLWRYSRDFYTIISPYIDNYFGFFYFISTYLNILAYVLFFQSFLNKNNPLEKKIKKMLDYSIIALIIVMLLDIILNQFGFILLRESLYQWSRLLMVIGFSYIINFAFRLKNSVFKYLGWGSLMIVISSILGFLNDSLIPKLFNPSISTERFLEFPISLYSIGFLMEMLFFALALGQRTKLFELEKQKAIDEKEWQLAKSKLFTNITHELRTPLTIIKGNTNFLIKAPKIKLEERLKNISQNTNKIAALINDILELAKLETKGIKLKMYNGNLSSYINYLVKSFQPIAVQNKITLSFHSSEDEILMDFSKKSVQTIIDNLISNALKFTPEFGKIAVKLYTNEDKQAILSVMDSGKGIHQNNLAEIFEPFYQSTEEEDSYIGTGLGLAIVKQLVLSLKGKIEVSSEIEKGTLFIVTLPITNIAPPFPKEELEKITIDGIVSKRFALRPLSKVLIVEDNQEVSKYLGDLLSENYNTVFASNGQIGLEKAKTEKPDIIILDEMMPIMTGFELLKKLKNDEFLARIPVIMFTARASKEEELKGLTLKADAYLAKPLDEEKLLVLLHNFISNRKNQYPLKPENQFVWNGKLVFDKFMIATLKEIKKNYKDKNYKAFNLKLSLQRQGFGADRKLERAIKKDFDTTPAKLIKDFRLEQSKVLIANSLNLSIGQIIDEVGLECDQSYFTKIFKERFKITPNDARK